MIAAGANSLRELGKSSVAVLFLATGTAQAQSEPCGPAYSRPCTDADAQRAIEAAKRAQAEAKWELSWRRCRLEKLGADDDERVITFEDIPDILKGIKELKKCNAFWQCVEDRDAGKVKHCYENDRRWR
jgi:hypothetical protein